MLRPTTTQLNAAYRILLEFQSMSAEQQQNCQDVIGCVAAVIGNEVVARNAEIAPNKA